MKHALRIAVIALALGLTALLVVRLGPGKIAEQLLAAGPGFAWILLVHFVAISVSALGWYVLLPRDARPTVVQTVASRFVSAGANAALPLFGFAGDLVRLYWLRRTDRAAGVAALVLDRLMLGAALAVVLLLGVIGLLHARALPEEYTMIAAAGAAGFIAFGVAGAIAFRRFRLAGRMHRLIQRMRRKATRDGKFGNEVDRHVAAMLGVRRPGPWLAWLIHVAHKLLVGLEIVIGFALLGVHLSWDEAFVFMALPVITSLSGALVPSQIGVKEGAFALVAASWGIDPATAVAVVLLERLRQVASVIVIAAVLAFQRDTLRAAAAVAKGSPGAPERLAGDSGARERCAT